MKSIKIILFGFLLCMIGFFFMDAGERSSYYTLGLCTFAAGGLVALVGLLKKD